jgi:FkbM family methyltransferase
MERAFASWRAACERLLAREPALYAGALRLLRSPDLGKRIFVAVIRRGDVVFDVGANRGAYTALFSRLAGPGGRVHAFEPVPPTCDALVEMLHMQRIENVVVNRTAIGEAPGELPLHVPGDDFGQASLARHDAGSWTAATAVRSYWAPVETIDDYARRRGLARLDFVKCDVEGAELAVLRGAGETLRGLAPLLYLEVCADWTASFGYAPPAVAEHLRAFGYSDFYLVRSAGAGGIRRLEDPAGELAPERLDGSADLLCAQPGHRARLNRLASLAGGIRWS